MKTFVIRHCRAAATSFVIAAAALAAAADPAAELRALSKCEASSVELLLLVVNDGIGCQERFELEPALSRSVLASFGNARTERISDRDRADGEHFALVLRFAHAELSAGRSWLHCVRVPGETNDVHVCFYEDTPSAGEARVPGLGALLHEVWEAETRLADKPDPLPTEEETAVRAKLNSIVIDSLEYRNARLADVLADLGELSRELDEGESDPAKRGVNLVLDAENADDLPLVTLKARFVSLGSALELLADMSGGLEVSVVGPVVLLESRERRILERMYSVRPDAASGFLGDGKDWRNRLADHGVEWPDGSSVAYLPSIGKLVVANTRKNLVRVELALGKTDPATQSPAADDPHAESAEDAEP